MATPPSRTPASRGRTCRSTRLRVTRLARVRIAGEVLLSRSPRPTAILTLSDQLAFGVFEAAKKVGLSIPEDLSVVGFDDVPEASRTGPPLTTVYQPHLEKGLVAGRMLVAQLEDEEPRSPESLPTRLVVRGSTARPRTAA